MTLVRDTTFDAPMAGGAERCLNCGAALAGAYCAACGQQKPHNDLTLREFIRETTHELTSWDGKVPRTLLALLRRPGLLTADFLAGRRARWLAPLRLYLLCSLVFFLSGPAVEALTHRGVREVGKITIKNADGSTTLTPETRQEIAEGLPGRIFGVDRMERAASHSAEFNRALQSAYPKAMFVLLPLFALLTSLAWRRRYRYPAHLYLALHLHAAWFLVFAVVTVAAGIVESSRVQELVALVCGLYVVWYSVTALHAVFVESWPRTIMKSVAVSLAYLPCWFGVSLGMLAYAIFTM